MFCDVNHTLLTTTDHAFGPPSLNFKSFMSGRVSNLEGSTDSTIQPSAKASLISPANPAVVPLRPTLLRTVFWVFAADVGSVSVDFLLRHDPIVVCVSSVKVPQQLLDISLRRSVRQ